MFYATRSYSNELYHHGVKGMKWGVRRYTNKDGSLNNAGKRRYADTKSAYRDAKAKYKQANRAYSRSYDEAYNYSSRHMISQFTNKAKKAKSDALWETTRQDAKRADAAKNKYKQAKSEYKDAKKAYRAEKGPKLSDKQKKAIKVGVAVAGTALAVYGTYRLAKYVQNKRLTEAAAKAEKYISDDFLQKYGETKFANGKIESYYRNAVTDNVTITGRGSKEIGKYNARVVARGRQIYKDATNTRLDRGLSKVVNAGDAVGNATRKAGSAAASTARNTARKVGSAAASTARNTARKVGSAARNAGNRVLDKVDPIYETVPGEAQITKSKWNGMDITQKVTPYYKRKVRRG